MKKAVIFILTCSITIMFLFIGCSPNNKVMVLNARQDSEIIQTAVFSSIIKPLCSLISHDRPAPKWNEAGATQAVKIAQSYINAIANGREFVYQAGNGVFDGNINDSYEKGIMDCSTFIGLILRGIDYYHSPYATGNISDIVARTDLYEWADKSLDAYNIRYACDYGEYMFKRGRVFYDMSYLKPGDLLFHKKEDPVNDFRSIWHVSIVAEVTETEIICYHCLYGDSKYPIRSFKFSSRSDALCAARPNYGAIGTKITE